MPAQSRKTAVIIGTLPTGIEIIPSATRQVRAFSNLDGVEAALAGVVDAVVVQVDAVRPAGAATLARMLARAGAPSLLAVGPLNVATCRWMADLAHAGIAFSVFNSGGEEPSGAMLE